MRLAMLTVLGFACVWDSDTLRDELQTEAGTFDLISGQFPHHGKAYYEARIRRNLETLKEKPEDRDVRNDLAVGYLKVGRYEESLKEFRALETSKPGEYRTLSNLGVLHKKMGEYGKAAKYTERALEIKPEGHLGLGDYYLHMLRWLDRVKTSGETPAENFLGQPYKQYPGLRYLPVEEANRDRLDALIRSDRTFPDGLLVLGDQLYGEMNLNLALWAYVRAKELGHPNEAELDRRIAAVFDHWRGAVGSVKTSKRVDDSATAVAAIRSDLDEAAAWLAEFEKVEGNLVASDPSVDFAAVEAALKDSGVTRFRPDDRGIVRAGVVGLLMNPVTLVLFGAIVLSFFSVAFFRWMRTSAAVAA